MKLQGRALLCILTTVIAGVGVGCSGPPPTSDPYAEDFRQAKKLATSDFERAALERHGLVEPLVPPRYRSQYFAHIWGGGYAASYYGYAWAKVMDADAVAWFGEQGEDLRASGEHFRRTLLAPGGSVDPMETYRRFRGRDPQLQPLLDRLGLTLP